MPEIPKSITEGSRSMWTTAFGFIAGFANYFYTIGPALPTTRAEWMSAVVSASIAALGLGAKDAAVKK